MAIDSTEHTRAASSESANDAEYTISPSDIDFYTNNGHILFRGFVPPDAVSDLRRAVLNAHEALLTPEDRLPGTTTYDKAFRITENLWEIDDVVKKHVLSPRYAGAAAKLLGCRDVRVYHDLTFFKEGAGKSVPTPYHQDGHYWPLDTTKCITIWIPLIDCPLEMGPMSFVSGSHLNRDAAHLEITDDSDELIRKLIDERRLTESPAQAMKAGDATLHNCWTWHATGPNKTSVTREAFAIVYFDADAHVPTHPPTNKRRAANLAKWFPNSRPGELAATVKNPAVLAMHGTSAFAAPHIINIRTASEYTNGQYDSEEDAAYEGITREVIEGLEQAYDEKTIPGLLLYDELGLRLFEQITYQPEYYLTAIEIELLSKYASEIADTISDGAIIMELGAGALRKTALLLDALEAQRKSVSYYALDLSRSELGRTLGQLAGRYRYVRLYGLWGTYDDGRAWIAQRTHKAPVTVLWLGSSVGNMTRGEAAQFVKSFGKVLSPSDSFMLAADSRAHPAEAVRRAYDDEAGVTRRFALNILAAMNRLFGREILDASAFSYRPFYNEVAGRNEAYLHCLRSQQVVLESDRPPVMIYAGEHIRFAYSHKYNEVERGILVKKAGASVQKEWASDGGSYVLSLLSWGA